MKITIPINTSVELDCGDDGMITIPSVKEISFNIDSPKDMEQIYIKDGKLSYFYDGDYLPVYKGYYVYSIGVLIKDCKIENNI